MILLSALAQDKINFAMINIINNDRIKIGLSYRLTLFEIIVRNKTLENFLKS